jgi:uncharacterized RDD family membrane protein YckC
MNAIDRYVNAVLHNVTAPQAERQRIEADLRAHLDEAMQSGEQLQEVLDRVGSPEEIAAAFMSEVDLRYATFWRRLAAFAIDIVLMLLPVTVLGAIVLLFNNLVPPHPETLGSYVFGGLVILIMISLALTAVSIFLFYFPLLEGRFGQTLGKRPLGMRVLNENGMHIGYKQAFLRRISFYFDIVPFDALFVLFTEKRQRAFDIIARTVVVRAEI